MCIIVYCVCVYSVLCVYIVYCVCIVVGVLPDPMVQYRETKSTALWSDSEKALFREK